jgi:hypothetical protein
MTANPKKPYEDRNITRIDTKRGTHGHQVRFQRQNISHFFDDNKFGGGEKALEAARLYRDAMEKMIDSSNDGSPHFNKKQKSRNVSGHVGVYRTTLTKKKKQYVYSYDVWVAHYPVSRGKNTNKPFYIHKLGELEALRQAIEERKRGAEKYFSILEKGKKKPSLYLTPTDPKIKIWRYMDFTKFVSLLSNKGLFFPTAINFDDQFEGSFSFVNKKYRPLIYKQLGLSFDVDEVSNFFKNLRYWVGINCWHMNEFESAGMWSLYSKTNEAICIQSTYDKLRKYLSKDIHIGMVKYIDYDKEWIPEKNILTPFLYKRRSFEHERELRALLNLSNKTELDNLELPATPAFNGKWINVDLRFLIENIFVSPNSPNWYYDLVKDTVSVYKLNINVVRSSLEEQPFY